MKKEKGMMRFQAMVIFFVLLINIFAPVAHATGVGMENNASNQEQTDYLSLRYYDQLNEIEKELYKRLSDSKEDLLLGKEVKLIVSEYDTEAKLGYVYYYKLVKRAIKAYIYDNPEAEIWMDNYEREYCKLEGYIYMTLRPIERKEGNFAWEKDAKEAVLELERVATEFVKTLSGTDKEKLKQIHDWLVQRATYDISLELSNTRTVYGTVINGKSVCSGFAYAYKYIANLANLDVMYVTGKAYNAKNKTFEPHAWNVVYVEGKYYLVDVTFNLPLRTEVGEEFLFSEIIDKVHYADNYYFKYPF